jgi:hypothetical protein
MLTVLLARLSAPAIAQSGRDETAIERQFQQAVLDSAIKYEMLKPRLYSLQKVNFHLEQRIVAMESKERLGEDLHQLEITGFQQQIKSERRRRRRHVAAALLLGIAAGALTAR